MKKEQVVKFEIYQDRKKEWRWRLKASNGQVIAGPQEGYKKRSHCVRMVARIKQGVRGADVVEI